MTALSFYATIVFELKLFRLLHVFNAKMAETTVKIIQLQHKKVRLILVNIVVRSEVDWNINMALDHANQVQVLLDLLYIDGHFVKFSWVWSQVFILDVQIEDVEEWKT